MLKLSVRWNINAGWRMKDVSYSQKCLLSYKSQSGNVSIWNNILTAICWCSKIFNTKASHWQHSRRQYSECALSDTICISIRLYASEKYYNKRSHGYDTFIAIRYSIVWDFLHKMCLISSWQLPPYARFANIIHVHRLLYMFYTNT